jgi:transcriptional regulator GlxA family with amidase domain
MANATFYGYVRAMPRSTPSRAPRSSSGRARPVAVQILVFPKSTPIVPVGLMDLFRKASGIAASLGATRTIDVALVAASQRRAVTAACDLAIQCRHTLLDAPRADFVVVSPFDPEVLDDLSRDRDTLRFLKRAYARGADLASVCTGAFALAETGLLDGRQAATHWAFQDLFRARYPKVDLRPQEILVDAGRLLTTGGATSFLSFTLYLVERLYGAEAMRASARMFLIDERKPPQGAYAIFSGQKHHGDRDILKAQELIERTVSEALTIEDIAARVAMTRRTFIRRFKSATGGTPREYLQRARVEAAKRRLEAVRESVAEVATHVGYEDLAAFRRLFLRHTGLTPTDYRRRYAPPGARS